MAVTGKVGLAHPALGLGNVGSDSSRDFALAGIQDPDHPLETSNVSRDKLDYFCHNVFMPATMTDDDAVARRLKILRAARWCFLNFGFAKTSFEDIAKRANLSRTLLYRSFRDKADIYQAVFVDWLISRHPAARQAAKGSGSPYERLLSVCRLMALEPWAEMVGTPMGSEFLNTCEFIDPGSEALYRKVVYECVAAILRDRTSAEVFLLALDGLFMDKPSMEVLEERIKLLAARFTEKGLHP